MFNIYLYNPSRRWGNWGLQRLRNVLLATQSRESGVEAMSTQLVWLRHPSCQAGHIQRGSICHLNCTVMEWISVPLEIMGLFLPMISIWNGLRGIVFKWVQFFSLFQSVALQTYSHISLSSERHCGNVLWNYHQETSWSHHFLAQVGDKEGLVQRKW